MVAVLFVRDDSEYKSMFRSGIDCYDKNRDAKTFSGDCPVIAHPPCRAWGVLSHMANPDKGEKELAIFAVDVVRRNGGILEHPYGSKLWKHINLPEDGECVDEYGGFTVIIDQYDFLHIAPKKTKLYICGVEKTELPQLPPKNTKIPRVSLIGSRG